MCLGESHRHQPRFASEPTRGPSRCVIACCWHLCVPSLDIRPCHRLLSPILQGRPPRDSLVSLSACGHRTAREGHLVHSRGPTASPVRAFCDDKAASAIGCWEDSVHFENLLGHTLSILKIHHGGEVRSKEKDFVLYRFIFRRWRLKFSGLRGVPELVGVGARFPHGKEGPSM